MDDPPLHTTRIEFHTLEYAFVLSDNVERLRKRAHLSKKDLCRTADISRPTLDRVICACAHTHLDTIVKLADALQVTPMDLVKPPFEDVPLSAYRKRGRP